ncbi:hypothetical protein GCM10010191_10070 [Actinomadura vinacea]|uniref:Uncharacterized protein n=1 Tax=Actinomadura vinacea TaxID=115336 RepID=A0ABN3IHX7_9ACTN
MTSVPGFQLLAAPAGDTGRSGAQEFLESPGGEALVAICGAVAVVIVVIAVFRMVNGIGRGRPGEAFRALTFGLLIGGLLFNLNLTIDGVEAMSGLVDKVFQSISKVSKTDS